MKRARCTIPKFHVQQAHYQCQNIPFISIILYYITLYFFSIFIKI